ncbi:MAG: putative DNA binding domain-containing protein [Betaproteobacteria bacterium]|nr:putative DNA binding domain-containing protein [Betaproteobacteria bacterium]
MKENQHIEWKSSWRDEYLRWICGFANAEGGTLVIGKNDRGKVLGVPNAAKLLEDIPNKVRDILGIMVDVNLRGHAGSDYLEIAVPAYPNPISYKGEYCYRSGSTNQTLKGAALDKFLLQRYGRRWDGVPVPGLRGEDYSPAAFRLFRSKAAKSGRISEAVLQDGTESLLENLQLREGAYLKRAAALLFFDEPEKFVGGAYIKIGFFVTDDDLRYQDEIQGNLFEQVEKTLEILFTKYLKAYIRYEGIQRVEEFLFPAQALREALLNAVVHKDYSSGVPIQISVYEDKIVLWGAGQLPQDWTMERLLGKHPSNPYNPLIANAFFRAGYIELWGRGIEKINRECKEHGIAPPTYDYGMSGLMLTFHADKQQLIEALGREKVGLGKEDSGTTQETTQKTTQKTTQRILAALRSNPAGSRREIAELLGDITEDGVKYHLGKLRSQGRIRRIGPDKGGHWEIVRDDDA